MYYYFRHPPSHCNPEHLSRVAAPAESYYQTQPSRKRTSSGCFAGTMNTSKPLTDEDWRTMEGELEDI